MTNMPMTNMVFQTIREQVQDEAGQEGFGSATQW
jgi:hypothetical protein